jgi:hypothetical protein
MIYIQKKRAILSLIAIAFLKTDSSFLKSGFWGQKGLK